MFFQMLLKGLPGGIALGARLVNALFRFRELLMLTYKDGQSVSRLGEFCSGVGVAFKENARSRTLDVRHDSKG
jgi:hypothetical protein